MAKNVIYDALKSHFEAKRDRAIANLTVSLTNPVNTGAPSTDIIEGMVRLTRELNTANNCIKTLESTFEVDDNPSLESN